MKVTIKGKSIKKHVRKTIIFIPNAVCVLFYTVGTRLKAVKPTFFKIFSIETIFEGTFNK